jgi:hypothetical protein
MYDNNLTRNIGKKKENCVKKMKRMLIVQVNQNKKDNKNCNRDCPKTIAGKNCSIFFLKENAIVNTT